MKKRRNESRYLILAILVLLSFLFINLISIEMTQQKLLLLAKAVEEVTKPAVVSLVVIDVDCEECFNISDVVDSLKESDILNITEIETLSFGSTEASKLVSTYSIERLPTVLIFGEINKIELGGFENRTDALVLTQVTPPYIDARTGEKRGLVTAYYINSSLCELCADLSQILQTLEQNGVYFQSKEFLDMNELKAQSLIRDYRIVKVPAVLVSGEIDVYDIQLADMSFRRAGGFYILEANIPYVETLTNKVRGLVELILITDSSCQECYNVSLHYNILTNRFGLAVVNQTYVDVNSQAGRELIQKYNITKVPTIIIRGDIDLYELFKQVWVAVGSVEEDGSYVFRNMDALGGAVYKDLTTGEIVSPQQAREIVVEGFDFGFTPSEIRVRQGERVRIVFRNTGSVGHNLIVEGYGIGTNVIPAGATQIIEFVADRTGSFAIYCSVPGHRDLGMEGLLVVEPA